MTVKCKLNNKLHLLLHAVPEDFLIIVGAELFLYSRTLDTIDCTVQRRLYADKTGSHRTTLVLRHFSKEYK